MNYGDDTTGTMTDSNGTTGSWYGRNQIWSVVNLEKSEVAPSELQIVSTPLPAGLPLLAAGILGFSLLGRASRSTSC